MIATELAAEELLRQLVAIPSINPPGDERAIAAVVRELGQALGLPEPECMARDPRRPNLIYTIGSGAPALLIAGHMDTMPPGDVGRWDTDPFSLTRVGDRLVGLGSADMKAALAAMLLTGARLVRDPEPCGTLTLVFSADEENGSAFGMAWLAEQGHLKADAAVMAEPAGAGEASFDRLFIAQRGSCVAWLVANGTPGHSGEEVDARERASAAFAAAMTALLEAEPHLFAGVQHPVDGTRPRLNLGTMVSGGMVPFAHPPELRAVIEVRTLETQTRDGVLDELRRVLALAGLADRVSIVPAEAPQDWIPAGDTVTDERLLLAAQEAWRRVVGAEPRLAVLPAATDSSHLNAIGIPCLPAFGPGSLGVAHRPNESIEASDLEQAVELLEALVREYFEDVG